MLCSSFLLSPESCRYGRTVGEPAHRLLLMAGFTTILVFLYRVGKEGCRAGAQMPRVKFLEQQVPVWSVGQIFLNKCKG